MKKQLLILALLFCGGCLPANQITQTSTIDALLAGAYDGQMTCRQLLTYGNFGIGCFDKLDGEMIIIDGKVYQIKADGKVYCPALSTKTPFAAVCSFQPDIQFPIQSADFKTAESIVNEKVPNQNIFLAVEISGEFKHIKVRSVPAQQKPYPPLAEVAKYQPVFEMNDIKGTIVGFRTPPFAKGLNIAGCHFHFISDDFTFGGHILDFELAGGESKIDKCNKFLLILPEDDLLKDIDLSKDKTGELTKAEKSGNGRNDMNAENVAKQFVDMINKHDANGIYRLMSKDFNMIDSDGAVYGRTEQMRQGWIDYFKMFPDYKVEASEVFRSGQTVVLIGKASGTYTSDGSLRPENQWEVPTAWRAVAENGKIKVWQIFTNPTPVIDIMKKDNKDSPK